MWPLHKLNAVRVPFILDVLAKHGMADGPSARPLQGVHVLDIGCGAGLLSESMAVLGATVTGVDPAERNIAIAASHAKAAGREIRYLHGSVETLDDTQFDLVLNMEVVEHVDNLETFMTRCCELTRPGGLQFLATINRNPWSWLIAIVGAEYILGWLPRGTHRWSRFVRPVELESMLRADGLAVDDITGVAVNPLSRRFSLSPRVAVNYMLCASRETAG